MQSYNHIFKLNKMEKLLITQFTKKFLRTWKGHELLEMNLYHSVMGMISEVNELEESIQNKDSVNICEESSDIFYYLVVYCYYRGIPIESLKNHLVSVVSEPDMSKASIEVLYTSLSVLSDIVKKMNEYHKEPDYRLEKDTLDTIFTCINYFTGTQRKTIEECAEKLNNKLLVRYPIAFNEHDANNRNLEEEYEQLKD